MGTFVVLSVVLVLIFFAARSVIRDKKSGRCSGGCAGCKGGCMCGLTDENAKCSIGADKQKKTDE
ncbi:MAG: FeoB-associated Cys-rich membrane protein [Dorea sp.]|jgi:hypothetical protein|nr:FeoB-associated Cys-rich membrane protein [Dorea sp.]